LTPRYGSNFEWGRKCQSICAPKRHCDVVQLKLLGHETAFSFVVTYP
jgi:hypothetical protein